jgi:hypothetical protein
VLVRGLPPEAQTVTALAGPAGAWRLEHYLLADVWQAAAHSKKQHPGLPTRKQLQKATGTGRKSARQDALLRAQQRRIDRAATQDIEPAPDPTR